MRWTKQNRQGRRLRFENLESRRMLSSVPPQMTFLDTDGSAVTVDPAAYVAGWQAAESASLPTLGGTLEKFLTTAVNPADRVTQTGVGFDGVVELRLYPDSSNLNVFARCSATLLATGRHILTAAHCFTDGPVQAAAAIFSLPSGPPIEIFMDAAWLHPSWDGNAGRL